MNRRSLIIPFLIALATAPAARAQDHDTTLFGRDAEPYGPKTSALTFTAFPAMYLNGLGQSLGTAKDKWTGIWGMGLRLGWSFTENFEVDASMMFAPTKTALFDQNVYVYMAHILGQVKLAERVFPYLTAGAGGMTFDVDTVGRDNRFAFSYGGGLRFFPFRNLSIGPDVRGLTCFDPAHTALTAALNITYWTSSRRRIEPPPMPTPGPTPQPTPTPQPAPEPPPVEETQEEPPQETRPSPREILAALTGVIEGITFRTASSVLARPRYEILDTAAEFFREYGLRVLIEGHTDSDGSEAYNLRLSRERADSVKQYLLHQGVPYRNIETAGYGESRPIASNSTAEGKARNRRIEFRILNPEMIVGE